MIFKLSYNNQTHLYNKTLSIQNLTNYCSKVFRDLPLSFTFVYMSPKGQMTYIQTDADIIGLKYCCSSSNDMIVKLHIMRNTRYEHFDIDEDIQTKNIVRQNLQQMAENVFTRLEDQSHQQAVSQYLSQTYEKISQQIAEAENKMIESQVKSYLSQIYEKSSKNIAEAEHSFILQKPKKRKIVRFSPQKPIIHRLDKSLDEMVNEKVLQLIPTLVDKIYSKLEAKLNDRCKNCLKKEIQIENAIDYEINKKLASLSLSQNPEQY